MNGLQSTEYAYRLKTDKLCTEYAYRLGLQTNTMFNEWKVVNYRSQSRVVAVTIVVVDVDGVFRCRHYRSVFVRLWQRRVGVMRSN
jgi:hypothetical protein